MLTIVSCADYAPTKSPSGVGGKADGLSPFSMATQLCTSVGTSGFESFTLRYPRDGNTFASSTAFLLEVDSNTSGPADSSAIAATATNWGVSDAMMSLTQLTDLYDLHIRLVDNRDDETVRGLVTYVSDGAIFTDFVECAEFPFDDVLVDDPSCGDVGQLPCDDRKFVCDSIGYILVGGICENQQAAKSSQGPWGCDQPGDECCLDDDDFEFCGGTIVGCNRDAGICDLIEDLDDENL